MDKPIFEGGYLTEFALNPEYRGLVGWPVEYHVSDELVLQAKLLAICGEWAFMKTGIALSATCPMDKISIDEFIVDTIPVDELCWFSGDGETWLLLPYGGSVDYENNAGGTTEFYYPSGQEEELAVYCVPFLLAGTAERASELKEWDYGYDD